MPPNNLLAVAVRGAGGAAADKVAVNLEASDKALEPESKRAVLEKVDNRFGCVAGASSDFFPIYRRHRNRELERLEEMDRDWNSLKEAEHFQAKREAALIADEQATASKRAKRQKKKEAKKTGEKLRKEAEGINKFQGDGSFLEAMKSMSAEELEKLAKAGESEVPASAPKVPVVSAKQMSASSNIQIRDFDA